MMLTSVFRTGNSSLGMRIDTFQLFSIQVCWMFFSITAPSTGTDESTLYTFLASVSPEGERNRKILIVNGSSLDKKIESNQGIKDILEPKLQMFILRYINN